jgi:hypothetical protein
MVSGIIYAGGDKGKGELGKKELETFCLVAAASHAMGDSSPRNFAIRTNGRNGTKFQLVSFIL